MKKLPTKEDVDEAIRMLFECYIGFGPSDNERQSDEVNRVILPIKGEENK